MNENTKSVSSGKTLKDGPVICQSEAFLPEDVLSGEIKTRKDLMLAELNHVFKMCLQERGTRKKNMSVSGQFSVIYNNPKLSEWHTLSKSEQ